MRPTWRIAIVSLLLVPFLANAGDPPKEAEKELAKLQGVWKMLTRESEERTQEVTGKVRLWHIQGNKLLYEGREVGALNVHAGSAPVSLDLRLKEPERVLEAIGEVKDNRWTICINLADEGIKDRPVAFSTKGNTNYEVLVFERLAPKAADEALAAQERRGYIGVQIGLRDEAVFIVDAFPDSPAAKAGLKKGDILVQVGAAPATQLPAVVRAIQATKPGAELTLRIKRDGQEKDVTVKVGDVPLSYLDPLG